MTLNILTSEQRNWLETLADNDSGALRRRALVILMYDADRPTSEVAHEAGLSLSQTRYWRRQFMSDGMDIFPGHKEYENSIRESSEEISSTGLVDTLEEKETLTLSEPAQEIITPEQEMEEFPGVEITSIEEISKEPAPRKAKRKRSGKKESLTLSEGLPYPDRMESPGIEPDDSMSEAGRKIMLYHFAEMLRHEGGTRSGEDIEDLHDMRVATRRMRAAFDVFGEAFDRKVVKRHLQGLRATGRALGHVRDLDVFMEKAEHYLEELSIAGHQGLTALFGRWSQEREVARDEMITHLDSEGYEQFKRAFNVFVQTPGSGVDKQVTDTPMPSLVREIAPVLIYTRLGVVRAYDAILNNASIAQLHALRIEFKKLRYTVEYFREVLGPDSKGVIDEIKGLQDHLGDLNDADVACRILNDFLENWEANQLDLPLQERQNTEPIVAYMAYRHSERHRLMVTFPEAWAYFSRPEFRKNLALAVSVL